MSNDYGHPPALPSGVPTHINTYGITYEYQWSWRAGDCLRVRYQGPDGKKTYRPYHRNEKGEMFRGAPDGPATLYGTDFLPVPGEALYITEGEKCADAVRALGLPCVTSGGAHSAEQADWGPLRDVARVVILPDNDAPGRAFAQSVAAALAGLPGARQVFFAELPGLAEKGDVVDWIQAQYPGWSGFGPLPDGADKESLRAAFLEVVAANTKPVGLKATSEDWPEPVPLPEGTTVEAFMPELLPPLVRSWIEDIAQRLQCPMDFPAAAFIVFLGSVIGRQIAIRPKRHDDWTEVPNLWGAVVGPPSTSKSPAVQEVLKVVKALEAKEMEAHAAAAHEHNAQLEVMDAVEKTTRLAIKKAAEERDTQKAEELARELVAARQKTILPECRRYICNSTTVEKLGELLRTTPSGILLWRDELAGFLRTLEKQGHEADRAFYLEAWNGKQGFTYDTIGRGTIMIERATVSVFGTIQPGPMAACLRENLVGGGSDGLIPRFQIMVFPDPVKHWQNVDRSPDQEARRAAHELFKRMDRLDVHTVGAICEEGEIPYLHFAENAQAAFDRWMEEHQARLTSGDLPPALVEHLNKYRGMVPALALLLHLADNGRGPVSLDALRMALGWAEYLESHARRVYALHLKSDDDAAQTLLAKIRSASLPNPFTERDIIRKHWGGLNDDLIGPALEVLLESGHIRQARKGPTNTGGRPTKVYYIHPANLAEHVA